MPSPVDQFFPVTFRSRGDAAEFSMQVIKTCGNERGVKQAVIGLRPVVFQPLMPTDNERAFVSPGAAKLLAEVDAGFEISKAGVPLSDLPDGLALVIGDQSDRASYDQRKRS